LRTQAREQLAQLGSDWAMELGWRDMWAFIAKKGGNKLDLCVYCNILCSLSVVFI